MGFTSKINGLALCRSSKRNMEPFKPDEGKVFVAGDIISCEPVIQCNLTGDDTLIYQTFGGIGKHPYINDDGILMIDDVYLAFSSINPVTGEKIKDLFNNEKFNVNGKRVFWDEAWVMEGGKDTVKSHPIIKKFRKFCKNACLGLSYGLKGDTPDKSDTEHGLRNHMLKEGYKMSSEQAWECYSQYWGMYPKIDAFRKGLENAMRNGKTIMNPLGFRVNTKPKDAFNGVIQSTTSSILSLWEYALEERLGDDYQHVLCIHDELCLMAAEEKAGHVMSVMREELSNINKALKWTYPLRTEPQVGRTLYDIK